MAQKIQDFVQKLLDLADIKINGDRPWDIQIRNNNFYSRVGKQGSLGLGESYMDAWWEVESLDEFFYRVLKADLDEKIRHDLKASLFILKNALFNQQRKSKAFEIGEKHYDLGNDLYLAMLDPFLAYSCGYWSEAKDLAQAQIAKLDLICRKLNLQPGNRVLDIGGGWGSFAKYAAQKYGVSVDVITVSKEQAELGQKLCEDLPVTFHLQDYREIKGLYDHIVSVGMIEHVGYKNYRTYMEVVAKHLKDDGLFLLHTIGSNQSVKATDPWIEKYIFPNSMLPSAEQLTKSMENLFVVEDWHSFGADYDKTLLAWHDNFKAKWPELRAKYGDRFYRMWRYYLLACAGSFRARKNQLWQIVLSKNGVPGGYKSVR
ncbi:MAG: cyclopropane fatty acyl phospholipid synthase [Candidatus Falkowbacteria bacterium]|nr:cyclopropane fatty acyl phospholipid synthase [Candidatus Falkowbacteria bacterium]